VGAAKRRIFKTRDKHVVASVEISSDASSILAASTIYYVMQVACSATSRKPLSNIYPKSSEQFSRVFAEKSMLWRPESDKVRRYKRIRQIGRELSGRMFEVIPEGSLNRVARDMNIIVKGVFVFDSEEEMAFLQDRLIYDILWDGKNAVEHFEIEKGSDLSEMERKILEGMKGAYFSLFELVGTVSGETVQLSDLLSGNQVELMDISLSSTAPEGALFATRIFKIEDICMASGAAYPFLPEQKEVLISGLKARQKTVQRRRRKKPVARRIDFSDPRNYSLYFFRQYKKISPVEIRMSDEIFE